MSTALEYAVDATGCVSTNHIYREITPAQWEALPPVPRRLYSRYGPALEAIAQGKMVAFSALDSKKAWNIRRSVEIAAKRKGLRVETRNAKDPEISGGVLVLARIQEHKHDGV